MDGSGFVFGSGTLLFSSVTFKTATKIILTAVYTEHRTLQDPRQFGRIRIRIRLRNLAIFVSDLQDGNKQLFSFPSFFAYYFLNLQLHHFPKKKSHKEVAKQ
jgi:hypothetical protein